ncbi:hypothetical protein D1227_12645 [Henriciella mobilis]|uniref:hypothetical protein n=1 Tax=Henriciella mobilis TaxID=2305467 RepID=UPI000E660B5D|nr:hypothetical protein [Henriciella mobilis]RIJ21151.1 hypothetical protein D1227_12645 [Henriciella mobilis]
MSEKQGIYGRFIVDVNDRKAMHNQHADHINGFRVALGDGKPVGVQIQYEHKGALQNLTMDLDNANFLMCALMAFHLDYDVKFPDDPRDPNTKFRGKS